MLTSHYEQYFDTSMLVQCNGEFSYLIVLKKIKNYVKTHKIKNLILWAKALRTAQLLPTSDERAKSFEFFNFVEMFVSFMNVSRPYITNDTLNSLLLQQTHDTQGATHFVI